MSRDRKHGIEPLSFAEEIETIQIALAVGFSQQAIEPASNRAQSTISKYAHRLGLRSAHRFKTRSLKGKSP